MSRIKDLLMFLRIYICLIFFDIELKQRGFQYMFPQYIKKYPAIGFKKVIKLDHLISSKVNKLLYLIDTACAFYPTRAECLHRSFIAFRFLRQNFGIPVELVIGVKKFPFSAHAWLLYNGVNINESEEYTSQFNIILRSEKEGRCGS